MPNFCQKFARSLPTVLHTLFPSKPSAFQVALPLPPFPIIFLKEAQAMDFVAISKKADRYLLKMTLGIMLALTNSGLNSAAEAQQIASRKASLPPCTMDSFVYEAGGNAEEIYGDEGTTGLPPLAGFTKASRINNGIVGTRDQGLTTGHGSVLPDASGADEFLAPPNGEWGQGGVTGHTAGDNMYGTAPQQTPVSTSGVSGGSSQTVYSGAGGVSPNPAFPPAPGPGYYSIVGCGGDFQGWMSPTDAALGQTNWGQALYNFYNSSAFVGDPAEAAYEISQIQASGDLGSP
jgi:hypothetical protein